MRKLVPLCLVLATLPATAFANGYDVPNVSARDLGMVNAAVADQIDAGAVGVCPAALARLDGLSLSISGAMIDINTEWTATTADLAARSPVSTRFQPAFPAAIFASYSGSILGHGVGAGIGVNVPAGSNMFWPVGWAGRSRIIEADRRVFAFHATMGVEVLKQLRLGGGIVVYRTTEHLRQGLDPTTGTAELSTAGTEVSYDVSAEVKPFESIPLTIAVDYKHQAVQKLTGRAHFDVPATLAPLLQDQNVTHFLTYPSELNAGLAYRLLPNLTLAFGYKFARYQVYKEDLFVGDKPLPGPIVVARDYGNGHTFRFGAEWKPIERLALRLGFERDISGMPKARGPNGELLSRTYSPTLPDSNSWVGTFGVGWSFARNLAVNAALFYANMDKVGTTPGPAFQGSYETRVLVYSVGVSYNWAPGERIGHLRPL